MLISETLPDFPHDPPQGYSYEIVQHKRSVIAIWLRHHREYVYNSEPVSTIWGFYDTKKRCYHSPINSKKLGEVVDIAKTRPYTAMQIQKPMRPTVLQFF